MTCSLTRDLPIPSPHLDGRGRQTDRWSACLLMSLTMSGAWAHNVDTTDIPASGLRLGAAISTALTQAQHPLPGSNWAGVLGTGQPLRDRHGLRLEHAVTEVAGRLSGGLGGQLALGLHDREKPHLEAAWLDMPIGRAWHFGGGRHTVPTTTALSRAGHFDQLSLTPLAKQALFEGNWIDEGLAVSWQAIEPTTLGWLPRRIGAGVWRGQAFPAGGLSPDSADRPITLNARWEMGHTAQIEVFGARLQTQGRGGLIQDTGAGHSHGVPTCELTLTGRVCFDGRVSLSGVSVSWQATSAFSLSTTAVRRQEHGSLYASTGDTNYQGRTTGAWADLIWQLAPQWELTTRLERLVAHHSLAGPGASLVAQDANLLNNKPLRRAATALSWVGFKHWRLTLDGGEDRSSAVDNAYLMMRASWQFEKAWRP